MTTVKHFHSAMTGAPVLSGTAGSLIAILDACLVNGFALKTADSVVVSGGIATATFSTGHSFEPDVIALVTGATPAGLNGEKRVISTATNMISFDAAGIADGTAAGTITVKLAPAGWSKPFAGPNLGVYRSNDVTGTRMFLRVDDTGAKNARVVGYESMTDVNTGVGAFPLELQQAGGGYWPKADASGATARAWTLVADTKTLWIHMHTTTSNPGASGNVWTFGDIESRKSPDPYGCIIQCATGDISGNQSSSPNSVEYASSSGLEGPFSPRSFSGLGGSVSMRHAPEAIFNGGGISGVGGSTLAPAYPNGPDNSLILVEKVYTEPGVCLRGRSRGVFLSPQNCHGAFNRLDKVDGQGQFAGRKLLAVKCGETATNASRGVLFFDITGPWG